MGIFNTKRMSGLTSETAEHLILGAGVFAKNFNVGTDTYESAKAAGKLLGATTGGGEFKATKNGRYIQVDGAPENTKGLYVVDNWTTTLQTSIKEFTPDSIKLALAAAKIKDNETAAYTEIEPKMTLENDDYIDNITFIGRLTGSEKPVIIQIYNAFNTNEVSVQPQDGNEGNVQLIMSGHYTADDLDTPPFKVFYPTATAAAGGNG